MKLLIGGSPCTHWSIAQKNNRETEPSGIGWELFKNFLIAKEKFKPDFFLYENNKSASQAIKDQIAHELDVGIDPQARFTYINSSLVSAQSRERFYVTNFGNIEQPEDRHLSMCDVLDESDLKRSYTNDFVKCKTPLSRKSDTLHMVGLLAGKNSQGYRLYDMNGKSPTLRCKHCIGITVVNDMPMTLRESGYEKLQTMPQGYIKGVPKSKTPELIGNGWTAEVIIHLLKHIKIPLDEQIVVLSMYDGIGTGRYCLDKMGFTNIKYHAYEIDKYAMQIAMSNYPDIIQHGDAFAVREDDWKIL